MDIQTVLPILKEKISVVQKKYIFATILELIIFYQHRSNPHKTYATLENLYGSNL